MGHRNANDRSLFAATISACMVLEIFKRQKLATISKRTVAGLKKTSIINRI